MSNLGDEHSETTERSLRTIERKIDGLGGRLDLVAQRLDMYDIGRMKQTQEDHSREITELQNVKEDVRDMKIIRQEVTELKTRMGIGAVVAVAVLGAVVVLVFKTFAGV